MTGLDARTVRAYLRCPTFPGRNRGSPVNGPLEPCNEYILQRWVPAPARGRRVGRVAGACRGQRPDHLRPV